MKKQADKPQTFKGGAVGTTPYSRKGVRTGNSYGNRPAVRKLGKK